MTREEDDTPRLRMLKRERDVLDLGVSASNHPRVKVARVWHSTIVTSFAIAVVGGLAALQSWPPELTLGALGGATGLWAFGALKR